VAETLTQRESEPKTQVTYYTISDQRFFPGTVALLNSLRLTGNTGDLVVLDANLTPSDRELLGGHATIVPPTKQIGGNPILMKPYPHLLEPFGIVVLYDVWGLVVNEAQEYGLPVITTDQVGAAADLIDPGVTGLIVPAGSVDALPTRCGNSDAGHGSSASGAASAPARSSSNDRRTGRPRRCSKGARSPWSTAGGARRRPYARKRSA
jgi:Glycosyl transferases group 1